jgi:hypothetical protein
MQRTLLAFALIASAGATVSYAQAQTYAQPQPYAQPMQPQAAPTTQALDPYGHPILGRNDWVAQPGDRINAGAAPPVRSRMSPDMAQAPSSQAMPMQSGPRQGAFKDEYGHRYDAQGNRIDGRGNIISPQTR